MDRMLRFERSEELGSHLTEQVVQLREDQELLDYTLITEGQTISCHRLVLAANSPMLKALLRAEMKEASSPSTELNIPYRVLANIIDYMYTGIADIPGELLQETLVACDYLALDELKTQCAEAAAEHLQAADVFRWSRTARKLNVEHLVDACQHYIFHNILEVMVQEEYHELSASDFKDLLHCSGKANVSGDDLFPAVLEWVSVDPKVRGEHILHCLSCTRICLDDCSNEMLKDVMRKYEKLFDMNTILYKIVIEVLMKKTASDKASSSDCGRKTQNPEAAIQLGDEIVILGGYDGSYNVNTAVFLLKDDNLKQYSTLPNGISDGHSVCQIPGGLVSTGGLRSDVCTIFLHTSNKWSETTSMPVVRYLHASSFLDGLLYVLGGYTGEHLNKSSSVSYLNMKTSKWHDAPCIPDKKWDVLAATLNQKLFVVNKEDGYLYSLDSGNNMSWSRHRKLSGGMDSMCAGDGKLFVVSDSSIISWYTVASDQWCTGTRLAHPIKWGGMAFYKKKVVIVDDDKVQEYDTERNVCTVKVTLPCEIYEGFTFFCDTSERYW